MHAHIERQSAVPWWAAFGAPLIGVPLLVVLLALGSPKDATKAPAPEPDAGFATEQVDPQPVDWTAELQVVDEADAQSRC